MTGWLLGTPGLPRARDALRRPGHGRHRRPRVGGDRRVRRAGRPALRPRPRDGRPRPDPSWGGVADGRAGSAAAAAARLPRASSRSTGRPSPRRWLRSTPRRTAVVPACAPPQCTQPAPSRRRGPTRSWRRCPAAQPAPAVAATALAGSRRPRSHAGAAMQPARGCPAPHRRPDAGGPVPAYRCAPRRPGRDRGRERRARRTSPLSRSALGVLALSGLSRTQEATWRRRYARGPGGPTRRGRCSAIRGTCSPARSAPP